MSKKKSSQRLKREVVRVEGQIPGIRSAEERTAMKSRVERYLLGNIILKRLNFHKVHPHKFRRTLATMAIDKGMPIEQVQQLLGHQSIDTTLHYAMVNQVNVKNSCKKFIG